MAEHRVVASVVEGSNPFTHPRYPAGSVPFHGGPLAQLVEQLTLNQRVWSSSLQRPTTKTQENHAFFCYQRGHDGLLDRPDCPHNVRVCQGQEYPPAATSRFPERAVTRIQSGGRRVLSARKRELLAPRAG